MLKKLNNVLSNKEKLYLLFVFFGAFIASSIDVIGIGSIVLYITFLSNPNEIISKIPFNNISRNGYSEVKAIAKRSGIKKLVAVNVEGKVFDLENPGDFGRAHIPG